jgi:hypothetical protein
MATGVPTNIRIPYSEFLNTQTGRPSQEWLMWLMNPDVIGINLANALGVTSGGTGLAQIPTNGQLLIGNGKGYTLATLTPGEYIQIVNGSGSIKIDWENLLPQNNEAVTVLGTSVQALQSQTNQANETIASMQTAIDALASQPRPMEVHPIPYGSFYDTTTQTGSVSAGTPITFNSTDISIGVYIGSTTSRIYVTEAGVYNFQFSIQTQNTDASISDINLWIRINGTDLNGSNGLISIPAKHAGTNGHSIVGWNYFLTLAANDYVELIWLTSATTTTIHYYAAGAIAPATYSAILTATKVNLTTG